MRVSDGTLNLFSSVIFFMACAGIGALILRYPDAVGAIVQRTAAEMGLKHAAPGADQSASAAMDDDGRAVKRRAGDVVLKARLNGHFETGAEVNGRDIDVMVDTGATNVALTYEDARRAGINVGPTDFTHQTSTANGIAKVAPVKISKVAIGNITVRNVDGVVMERGKLEQTLLGMSFLSRLSKVEMGAGQLVLHE